MLKKIIREAREESQGSTMKKETLSASKDFLSMAKKRSFLEWRASCSTIVLNFLGYPIPQLKSWRYSE